MRIKSFTPSTAASQPASDYAVSSSSRDVRLHDVPTDSDRPQQLPQLTRRCSGNDAMHSRTEGGVTTIECYLGYRIALDPA